MLALLIEHGDGKSRIILLSVACLHVPYFSTLSHTRHYFRGVWGGGVKLMNTKFVF